MRSLVKQYLDGQISRRTFFTEMAALGVSAASANALFNFTSDAFAAEEADSQVAKEVVGNGGDLLMESLLAADVKYIFHGCGAGIEPWFDSVLTRPQFKNFLATNESQCVAMAEGYHLASGGELGVVIVPKPGLGYASGNIYNALIDRSSLLIITAREGGEFADRRGDLEFIDWQDAMDPFVKWSYKMHQIERVPEFTRKAITVANTPPGGPTFLQMTVDLTKQQGTAKIFPQRKFQVSSQIKAEPELITDVAKSLIESKSPLITVGNDVTKTGASEKMIELAELLALPVTQGISCYADFPNHHPLSLGQYSRFLPQARGADFYLNIGSQMPLEGGYGVAGPAPTQARAVHISLETEMLGTPYPTDVSVVANAKEVISDLIDAVESLATKERLNAIREQRFEVISAFTESRRKQKREDAQQSWNKAPMTVARVSSELNALLEDDAIIVTEPTPIGAAEWFDIGYGKKTEYGGSTAKVLGWATGVALGVKLAKPDNQVVALSGDGAFMYEHNLWSLSRYDAPIIVVIYNNHSYNMNRAFGWLRGGAQAEMEKDLVGYLGDPDVDFARIAGGYGVDGEVVNDPSELKPAIQRAIQTTKDGKPYLLDVQTERWGRGGELTWHPDISIANMRTRKI